MFSSLDPALSRELSSLTRWAALSSLVVTAFARSRSIVNWRSTIAILQCTGHCAFQSRKETLQPLVNAGTFFILFSYSFFHVFQHFTFLKLYWPRWAAPLSLVVTTLAVSWIFEKRHRNVPPMHRSECFPVKEYCNDWSMSVSVSFDFHNIFFLSFITSLFFELYR